MTKATKTRPKNRNSFDKYSTKRVSYILITKNRASLLDKSLHWIETLLTKIDELIIVDGGSTDKTLEVIKKHKRIIDKFISEKDLMPSHAGNKGVLISQGKYIKMLTDDDIIFPDAMEKAIEIMEKNPDIDILECGGTRYRKKTKTLETIYRSAGKNYQKGIDDAFEVGINVIGIIIRRSSLAKTGLFPLNLFTDSLFLMNALRNDAVIKFARIKLYHQTIYNFSINQAHREELASLFYKAVKENASRRYYYRFAFNWILNERPYLKPIFLPLIMPLKIYKEITKLFHSSSKSKKNKKYIWDGSF